MAPTNRPAGLALAMTAALGLAACGQEAEVDEATIDRGAMRNPPSAPPPRASTTLEGGAAVLATPAAVELQQYLQSGEAAGRRFRLDSIRFVQGMDVREDPDGSVASIAAILNNHPQARIRLEVEHANPEQATGSAAAEGRAEEVAKLFVANGVPAGRIEAAGVKGGVSNAPRTYLVVTAK